MAELIVYRGLPGCGKSTAACAWVAEDPQSRARINRDSLRAMAHDSVYVAADGEQVGTERAIEAMRDAAINAALSLGVSVVCDDTNLASATVRALRRLAVVAGAPFVVRDMTDVPIELCIARDAGRIGHARVGENVIRDMWERYLKGKSYPLPIKDELLPVPGELAAYEPVPGTPTAFLVDIDGTSAHMGGRNPYDETRVLQDKPNPAMVLTVQALYAMGHQPVFCSGRSEDCRADTEAWIREHVGLPDPILFMRASGDGRTDALIKLEIFDQRIRHRWNVVTVFDDRQQVVDMWRSIGLQVFQVAPGNF